MGILLCCDFEKLLKLMDSWQSTRFMPKYIDEQRIGFENNKWAFVINIKMLLKKSKLIPVLYFSLLTVSTAVSIRSAQNHARKHFNKRQVEVADDGLKLFIRNLFPDIVKVIFLSFFYEMR